MRKVKLYIATSLDGYIASEDGSIDWLNDPAWDIEGEDFGYTDFMNSVDTTLMGNKTYQQVLGFDVPFPYPDYRNIVFSRSQKDPDEHAEFYSGDIPTFVEQLKSEPGKDIWLIGGSQVNGELMEAGLIDQIRLTIIPVSIGSGICLFSGGSGVQKFRLTKTNEYPNGMVQLTYNKPGMT